MSRYLIAVKREHRDKAPQHLAESVDKIVGLTICGDRNATRLMIEATDEALEEVKNRFGDVFHIEAPIAHKPM